MKVLARKTYQSTENGELEMSPLSHQRAPNIASRHQQPLET